MCHSRSYCILLWLIIMKPLKVRNLPRIGIHQRWLLESIGVITCIYPAILPKDVHCWTLDRSVLRNSYPVNSCNFTMSSVHRVENLLKLRLPVRGHHSWTLWPHRLPVLRAICLAHRHLSDYIGDFGSSADLFITDSITQWNTEHSYVQCPLTLSFLNNM